jgi:hypothetical protein
MNGRKFLAVLLGVVLVAGVLVFAIPNSIVAAQTPTPQSPSTQPKKDPQAQAAAAAAKLEKAYQAELSSADKQGSNFDKLDKLSGKVSDLIAKAKANGKDTSALEAGMAKFNTRASDARKIHDGAVSILKTHAGFDANGKVTDRLAARDTVQNVHNQLQDARQAMARAIKDFRQVVKDWRDANKPVKPAATPTTNS